MPCWSASQPVESSRHVRPNAELSVARHWPSLAHPLTLECPRDIQECGAELRQSEFAFRTGTSPPHAPTRIHRLFAVYIPPNVGVPPPPHESSSGQRRELYRPCIPPNDSSAHSTTMSEVHVHATRQQQADSSVDPELLAQGLSMIQEEKEVRISTAIRNHWRAMAWSITLSFALVMDGEPCAEVTIHR